MGAFCVVFLLLLFWFVFWGFVTNCLWRRWGRSYLYNCSASPL